MTDPFAGLAVTGFAAFGEPATYIPVSGLPFPAQVVVEYDVQRYSDAGVIEQRNEISLLITEVSAPRRNDTIATETESFKVDRVVSKDKYMIKVAVW